MKQFNYFILLLLSITWQTRTDRTRLIRWIQNEGRYKLAIINFLQEMVSEG